MRTLTLIVIVMVAVLLAPAGVCQAAINTGAPTDTISPFGEPGTATYGQTFTVVGSETLLTDFTFYLDDDNSAADATDFAAYLMAWDGGKAAGPILYESEMRSTTNNGGADGMEMFAFNTGGTLLVAGGQYVAFLSSSQFFDGSDGTSFMGTPNANNYAGGAFVYAFNGSDFSALTSEPWHEFGIDASFQASFTEPTAVPEPTMLVLWCVGALGASIARYRRGTSALS